MEKKNIDWGSLGFEYTKTDKRFEANFKDGKWDEGGLIDDEMIPDNSGSFRRTPVCCFHEICISDQRVHCKAFQLGFKFLYPLTGMSNMNNPDAGVLLFPVRE